jgi:predicted permease
MIWKDVRFGLRTLARQPAFAAVATLTLALGIGADTAIFTLFNAILLQSLPVRDPSRLVLFSDRSGEGTQVGDTPTGRWQLFSSDIYQFFKSQPLGFESLAAVRSGESPVSLRVLTPSDHGNQAARAQAHLVSGNYFEVMGVAAAAGRTLTVDDDRAGAAPAAVISYGFWSERMHADPRLVGATVSLNGTAFTIVGVMPREFFGERVRRPPDFWMPLIFQPQIELRPSYLDKVNSYWLILVGRLANGATREQAQTAASGALRRYVSAQGGAVLSEARKAQLRDMRIELVDGARGISGLRQSYSQPLRVLLVVVLLVLLIACANVGNLLLSRAAARRPEISVRLALGATRGRLVRQLLIESALLAVGGAIAGLLLARWIVSVTLSQIVSRGTPLHATLDARVLLFTAAVTGAAAIVFGLMPALAAGDTDLTTTLKSGGRGAAGSGRGARATRALVVAQIAISLVLLVGANLFARNLLSLERQPLGFDADRVLLARVNPRLAGYTPASASVLHRKLYDRVSALPGVTSATIARYSPLSGSRSVNGGTIEGYKPPSGDEVDLETIPVGPSYPSTFGMTLLQGRAIGPQDVAGAPNVAMVNETFVRQFLPRDNPIGRHLQVNDVRGIEIVGVLRDARFRNDRDPILPTVFTALAQENSQFALDAEIAIRTAGDPASAAAELRRAVAEVDPNLPVNDPKTLREQVASNFDTERLATRLIAAFGGLALLLACVGLYGVVTQAVVRRTNEIGVRMALGAQRGEVVWMILRETLALLLVGLAIGIPVAAGAARLVASQLAGLRTIAPDAFLLSAAGLALVAVVTGLLPAARASRVDPIQALRCE